MVNEIHVKVSFANFTLTKRNTVVVEGDYNTTKLIFEFEEDVTDRQIKFSMTNSKGELVMFTDLINNEIILVDEDEDGNLCSVFNDAGMYTFHVYLMGENEESQLTSPPGYLPVVETQVNKSLKACLPLMNKLVNAVEHMEVETDLEYNPESKNAQSGIAVSQAIEKSKEYFPVKELVFVRDDNLVSFLCAQSSSSKIVNVFRIKNTEYEINETEMLSQISYWKQPLPFEAYTLNDNSISIKSMGSNYKFTIIVEVEGDTTKVSEQEFISLFESMGAEVSVSMDTQYSSPSRGHTEWFVEITSTFPDRDTRDAVYAEIAPVLQAGVKSIILRFDDSSNSIINEVIE